MPVYIDAAAMRIIPTEHALKGAVFGNSPHLVFFVIERPRVKSERSLSQLEKLLLIHRFEKGKIAQRVC